MSRTRIVVSVNFRERSLTVYSSDPDADAVLVDWEPGDYPSESPHLVGVNLPDGRHKAVWVVPLPVRPIEALSEQGLEQAVDITRQQGTLHARNPI